MKSFFLFPQTPLSTGYPSTMNNHILQGMPSAMKLYAIGLLPLTQKLKATAEFVTNEREISQIRVNV